MATPFYPQNAASDVSITGSPPRTITETQLLSLSRGGSARGDAEGTVSGTASGSVIRVILGPSGNTCAYVSNPLDGVTISSAFAAANLRALESSAMANYGIGFEVWRLGNSGAYISTIRSSVALTAPAAELATAQTAQTGTPTVTSTTLSAGDRIALVPLWYAQGGTSAAGFTVNFFYNGPTAGASGDSFISFAETITEQAVAAAVPPPVNVARTGGH